MTTRMALSIGFVAVTSLGAAALYIRKDVPPACTSDWSLNRVAEILRDDFHLDSVLINNVRTVSGGFFSHSHDCSAEVAEVRGSVDASDMSWRGLRYRIVHQDAAQSATVTVELAGQVPLAPEAPSFWTRLLAQF